MQMPNPNLGASLEDSRSVGALQERIDRIENGLPPISLGGGLTIDLSLPKLMELYRVPRLSVAVVDNFEIDWAKGYGVAEAGAATPVTTRTLFQAGSVSKPVAAAGALSLVEEGKLSLDGDVNEKLTSWKVPDNQYTKDEKVTLRRILSHSAGLTVHFYPGHAAGDPLPSLVQVLNGEPPANTKPVHVDVVPGSEWRYSGGGYLVAQQLMIDVTGKSFPQLMRESVFEKIGMDDSTFEQPLPDSRAGQAASGTYWNGQVVPGKWHVYPEMAAAGLWSTPSDLARFAIEIASSTRGKSNRLLSSSMTREMLTPQMEHLGEFALGDKQHPDRMGLGFFLGDESRPDLFGHIGDDEGFQAMLLMYAGTGQGAVIMANSQIGILLGDLTIESIAQEYGWKNHIPPNRPRLGPAAALTAVAQALGTQAAVRKYWDLKRANSPRYAPDENTLLVFGYSLLAANKIQDAIEALTLEVQEYPDYWSGYDVLADMYMLTGDKQPALQNLEKAIELNPDNQGAIEKLNNWKARE